MKLKRSWTHAAGLAAGLALVCAHTLADDTAPTQRLRIVGGLAGVCIAWVVAVAVRTFSSVPMSLPWSSVITGVGLSAVVGLFFGIYPARRASKLDPIEALRVER